jgi:hypothetical protein
VDVHIWLVCLDISAAAAALANVSFDDESTLLLVLVLISPIERLDDDSSDKCTSKVEGTLALGLAFMGDIACGFSSSFFFLRGGA